MNPVYNTTKQNSIGVIDYSFGRNISLSTTTTKIFDNTYTDHIGVITTIL